MKESRKEPLIEKLAANPYRKKGGNPYRKKGGSGGGGPGKKEPPQWGKTTTSAKQWGKDAAKEIADPKALAQTLRKVLGQGAAIGGGILAAKYLKPKKSLAQKLVGEGTPGRRALMFGAGAAGIGAGLKGVESLGEAISVPLQKKKYFNNMMEENPGLKKENPKDVSKIFRTLHTFNPKMASDPLVAGSFLKRQLQYKDEGIQPIDVKTLAEVAKNMRDSKKKDSLLRSAFAASGSDLMGFAGK